jgi:hypothetical protein
MSGKLKINYQLYILNNYNYVISPRFRIATISRIMLKKCFGQISILSLLSLLRQFLCQRVYLNRNLLRPTTQSHEKPIFH